MLSIYWKVNVEYWNSNYFTSWYTKLNSFALKLITYIPQTGIQYNLKPIFSDGWKGNFINWIYILLYFTKKNWMRIKLILLYGKKWIIIWDVAAITTVHRSMLEKSGIKGERKTCSFTLKSEIFILFSFISLEKMYHVQSRGLFYS